MAVDTFVVVANEYETEADAVADYEDVEVAFERELGRVDADDDQPLIRVSLGPGSDVRERSEPVDAGVTSRNRPARPSPAGRTP